MPRCAWAAMPDRAHSGDIKRFGLDNPNPARKPVPPAAQKAISRFQSISPSSKGLRVRALPSGLVGGVMGILSKPQTGAPEGIASSFLKQNQDVLAIDPASLQLGLKKQVGGLTHLLYQQTLNGLPVEFSRVKVHLSQRGEVLGVDSGFIPSLNVSPVPAVSQSQAAAAVAADLGQAKIASSSLVYLPVYNTGDVRLAWKVHASGGSSVQNYGVWNYYVDAQTGQVLFRYNDLTYACPAPLVGNTGGTAFGYVYDIDPSSSTVAVARPMPYQKVFVFGDPAATLTDTNGTFCSATSGKIVSGLQGAFVNVADSNDPSVHFDNGGGVWFTAATPVSSPNPYRGGSTSPNSVVFSATVNSPVSPPGPPFNGGPVSKVLPHFSSFQVGAFSPSVGISEDDELRVVDPSGSQVAAYIGNKGAFFGPAVMGTNPSYTLNLSAAPGDSQPGFSVDISSALVLTNSPNTAAADSSFVWTSTMTSNGGLAEVNVYYHINQMHDYFLSDIDKSSAAFISSPFPAMVNLGPNFANAFFNPDYNSISFGDMFGGAFALDATIVHHEYTHYVVNKIYPIVNFGQDGAVSEAIADYFSASSLNDPAIGGFVAGAFSSEGAVRNLACSGASCLVFPTDWSGEIHHDDLMLSQALWEIRTGAGQACADELVFQSLFFFPSSFQEFLDAMLQTDAQSVTLAPNCGPSGSHQALIQAQFAAHGISSIPPGADRFEPNDGPQSATNASTMSAVTANIFPAGDEDFYTFGAGPGPMQFTLDLPANALVPGTFVAYGLTLLDSQRRVLAQAFPTIDNATLSGNCQDGSTAALLCRTVSPTVQLNFNNPNPGQFYVAVTAAPTDDGSNSNANSTTLYELHLSYVQPNALSGSIVNASFSNDTINFSVNVSSFTSSQNISFAYAQLRDQSLTPIPQTATNGPSPFLILVSSSGALGNISGSLQLAPGFASRFPAVGNVFVEIFGFNALQLANSGGGVAQFPGLAQSMGVSNPIALTANGSGLTAYNNIIRPSLGQKATFKFSITSPGHVSLKLYTMSGVLVDTLVNSDFPAGSNSVDWFGANSIGRTVASGIYLAHIEAPGLDTTVKVAVIK